MKEFRYDALKDLMKNSRNFVNDIYQKSFLGLA